MQDYFKEWEQLVNELSQKEQAVIEWEETYEIKSDSLLAEARRIKDETGKDIIKETYGGNNDRTRELYVKEQLLDWNKNIQDLELSIDWIKRRISFIKALAQYTTAIRGGE